MSTLRNGEILDSKADPVLRLKQLEKAGEKAIDDLCKCCKKVTKIELWVDEDGWSHKRDALENLSLPPKEKTTTINCKGRNKN